MRIHVIHTCTSGVKYTLIRIRTNTHIHIYTFTQILVCTYTNKVTEPLIEYFVSYRPHPRIIYDLSLGYMDHVCMGRTCRAWLPCVARASMRLSDCVMNQTKRTQQIGSTAFIRSRYQYLCMCTRMQQEKSKSMPIATIVPIAW
jgi:hypothetical protein